MNIDLTINTDVARKILTGFIKSEVTRAGFSRAIVGLSGGIDSALSCALAAEALGPESVLAVRMPYKTSSPDSLEDGQKTAEALQVQMQTFEITPMVDPLMQHEPEMSNQRKGNIMARCYCGMLLHCGMHNYVENNLFIDCVIGPVGFGARLRRAVARTLHGGD